MCCSCSVSMGKMHSRGATPSSQPQQGESFLSRNMRAVAPRNATHPTFSPRYAQHPIHPGAQSTSMAGLSGASRLA